MFVNSISIRREGYIGVGYGRADHSKPFKTTIEVEGQQTKIEMILPPEVSAKIVALIADEVAAAGRATAEAMVASCLDVKPILALKGVN